MPAFIWSNTVQQAEQEALKLGVKSADYQQSLAIANAVNDALDVMVRRGIAAPDYLKVDAHKFPTWARHLQIPSDHLPTAFAFSRRTGKSYLYLNPQATYWSDPAAEAKQQYQIKYWSSDHPHHAIWHELGHLMFFRKASTVYWKNPLLTHPEAAIAAQVSLYAEQSVREFMAETFAALLAGRMLLADVLNLYQQYGGIIP